MISASPKQKAFIDFSRHGECKHPAAGEFVVLEFLSCRRCGCEYVDGLLRAIDVVLEGDEQEGVTYTASYAGTLKAEAVA